jgi:Ni,Fe-hydrogenase III component G
METEKVLATAANLVKEWTTRTEQPEANRLDVYIDPANLPAAIKTLHQTRWGYLVTITGLDQGAEADSLEALYHFCNNNAILTLRVQIPKADPTLPTICGIISSASLVERELSEMFGITVVGTPDPAHLFLPDEWPDDQYPLRKDFIADALEFKAAQECGAAPATTAAGAEGGLL